MGTVKKHSTLSVIHTTNFNAARKNYMYQKELWMLFSIQGLGEADHSDRDSDSTGNLLEGQVPLLSSGELEWKRGSGEVYQ